jgi:hypothetical protein
LNKGHQVAETCEAPTTDAFTPYDEAHFALYLTLLHASADGWSEERMCRSVLKIEPENPRSVEILRSHLARARWLSAEGRRHLLDV